MLINRSALAAALGDKATPDAIDKQVKDIEQLVIVGRPASTRSAATTIKISVVDFVDAGKDLEPVAGPSYLEMLEHQIGNADQRRARWCWSPAC